MEQNPLTVPPKGFSPNAYYPFDSEIELVWDRAESAMGIIATGKGDVCVCCAGIYV